MAVIKLREHDFNVDNIINTEYKSGFISDDKTIGVVVKPTPLYSIMKDVKAGYLASVYSNMTTSEKRLYFEAVIIPYDETIEPTYKEFTFFPYSVFYEDSLVSITHAECGIVSPDKTFVVPYIYNAGHTEQRGPYDDLQFSTITNWMGTGRNAVRVSATENRYIVIPIYFLKTMLFFDPNPAELNLTLAYFKHGFQNNNNFKHLEILKTERFNYAK